MVTLQVLALAGYSGFLVRGVEEPILSFLSLHSGRRPAVGGSPAMSTVVVGWLCRATGADFSRRPGGPGVT